MSTRKILESINAELDSYHLRLNAIEGMVKQLAERVEALERKIGDKDL